MSPAPPERPRCAARTAKGERCRNPAGPSGLCARHERALAGATAAGGGGSGGLESEAPTQAAGGHAGPSGSPPVDQAEDPRGSFLDWAEEALEFLRRRLVGEYQVDDFGHDPDLVEHVLAPLLRPLYRHWWRVETRGLEHVPEKGAALVVGNHAGTLPFDAMMVGLAILDEHPAHRTLRMLAADLAFTLPVVAPLARKSGNTLACQEDAERLLRTGEVVGVWPEGYKGLGKPFRERYRLQRFGRGGFVELALRTGTPIVPVAVVGSEEIYPMIGNLRRLARLLGLPYFPVTPTFPLLGPLGMVPLPSRWVIEFCPPIATDHFGPEALLDPMAVFDLTDQVRDTIQQAIYRILGERGGVFR
ncbi:MAG TPA: lysophospholipid acyltransferase family protein [Actinomycetes bacterium]